MVVVCRHIKLVCDIHDLPSIPERNDMLEAELRDMKDLMVVVAPQHYIDDEALALHTRVQYTRPVEMQYDRITYGDRVDPHAMVSCYK